MGDVCKIRAKLKDSAGVSPLQIWVTTGAETWGCPGQDLLHAEGLERRLVFQQVLLGSMGLGVGAARLMEFQGALLGSEQRLLPTQALKKTHQVLWISY